jgi:hypothetical protein
MCKKQQTNPMVYQDSTWYTHTSNVNKIYEEGYSVCVRQLFMHIQIGLWMKNIFWCDECSKRIIVNSHFFHEKVLCPAIIFITVNNILKLYPTIYCCFVCFSGMYKAILLKPLKYVSIHILKNDVLNAGKYYRYFYIR